MRKESISITAALAAAVLCCGGGSAIAADLSVNDPADLTEENGWKWNEGIGTTVWAPIDSSSDNRITVSGNGDTSWESLAGGVASSSPDTAANKNTINLNHVKWSANSRVYGGYAYSSYDSTANENVVNMIGGSMGKNHYIYGGYAKSNNENAMANKNVTSLNAVTLGGSDWIYGGYAFGVEATADENAVSLNAVSEVKKVYGGYADFNRSWGGKSGDISLTSNENTVVFG